MTEVVAPSLIQFADPVPINILVVDDEPAFCAIVCEILRIYGFAAHPANGVQQALELMKTIKPDMVLADVMMPEIDGLTLLRTIRSRSDWESIPAIVISAKSAPEDFSAAFDAGANACLAKPFSASELRETVERFLYST
ncbi:MAG: response regulator [Anaerolineales bacterium]|jgi:CheY-like chemotaxis protein